MQGPARCGAGARSAACRRAAAAPTTRVRAARELQVLDGRALAARTLAIRVQPPAATAASVRADDVLDVGEQEPGCRRGVAGGGGPDRGGRGGVLHAQDDVVLGAAVAGRPRPGGRSPTSGRRGRAARARRTPVAPSAASTRRSSSPPLIPARSSVVPAARARPRTSRPGPCWRSASGRCRDGPGQHVRGAAGVEQLVGPDRADADGRHRMIVPGHRQDGAAAQATTVRAAQEPGGGPARAVGGRSPDGQPGRRQGLRPDRAGALVDETGPGRQRRLAHQVAAQGEDDPFRNAQPGRGRARAAPAARSHSSLARVAWHPTAGPVRLEGGGRIRGLAGQLLDLAAAAVSNQAITGRPASPAPSSSTPLSARPVTPMPRRGPAPGAARRGARRRRSGRRRA